MRNFALPVAAAAGSFRKNCACICCEAMALPACTLYTTSAVVPESMVDGLTDITRTRAML